jgi:predicted nucleotidyltransferase component of viral defense system
MISRTRLNELAQEWGVSERVVEKDYVIGWLLWGIGTEPTLRQEWVFKGGTCLKKCYIETYRFSEDLDFTILPGGPFLPGEVAPLFARILERVNQASGIDLAARPPVFKQRGSWPAAEGRIYYRGPRQTPNVESIKIDLLASERVVRPTALRAIAHPYADPLPAPDSVRCYRFDELFAEKIRALGERCRARDLYDVVNLYRRRDLQIEPAVIARALAEKCSSKGIPAPTFASIEASPLRGELASEWQNMLEHQVLRLPPFVHFWQELEAVFAWLEGVQVREALPAFPTGEDVDAGWRPPATIASWGAGSALERIRFAAANHLCVEWESEGVRRTVEPYLVRRSRGGALRLHSIDVASRQLCVDEVEQIERVRITDQPFSPVFLVEFAQVGDIGGGGEGEREVGN